MSSSMEKKLILKASDGEEFAVEEAVAVQALTIKHMVEDECSSDVIPIPNVDGPILAMVIEYCREHVNDQVAAAEDEGEEEKAKREAELERVRAFDKEFVETDRDTLYYLLMAANYLNVKGLLDIVAGKVANMIKGKTPEQIRKTFGIKNDFTPEEEEEVRRENAWAFE